MAPGARSKFGAPLFEPEAFRKKMYCIKKVLASLLGVFGAPIDLVQVAVLRKGRGGSWPPVLCLISRSSSFD